jgi:prophage regulatory protein
MRLLIKEFKVRNKNSVEHPLETNRSDGYGYSRIKAITQKYGSSPATIWRKSKEGTFPKPHKLSSGITAWKNCELLEWEKDPMNYRVKT